MNYIASCSVDISSDSGTNIATTLRQRATSSAVYKWIVGVRIKTSLFDGTTRWWRGFFAFQNWSASTVELGSFVMVNESAKLFIATLKNDGTLYNKRIL